MDSVVITMALLIIINNNILYIFLKYFKLLIKITFFGESWGICFSIA